MAAGVAAAAFGVAASAAGSAVASALAGAGAVGSAGCCSLLLRCEVPLPPRQGFPVRLPTRHPYEHDHERRAFPIWLLTLLLLLGLAAFVFRPWVQCTDEAHDGAMAAKARLPHEASL